MCLIRWSAASSVPRAASWKTVSDGRVAGAVVDAERAVAQDDLVALGERPRHRRLRAPAAEGVRHGPQREARLVGDAVAGHHGAGERVVGVLELAVAGEPRREQVERRDLGAGAPGEDVDEAHVVHVLVAHEDQLEILDAMPERREALLELVERAARVRPGVEQRERVVLEQVDVDPADGEGRRDRDAADALRDRLARRLALRIPERDGGRAGGLAGHERISSRTSSRAALHVLDGDERLEAQPQQRLGVRRAHVEVPVLEVDADAVEVADLGALRGVLRGDVRHLGLGVVDGRVDLAGDEVGRAVGLEQLAEALAARRQQLEHQQRRDRARVRAVEVAEVVVAADLAAEDRVLLAHARLEERVPDAVGQRAAAEALDGARHAPGGAHVVEDRRLRELRHQRLGEQRGQEVAVDERARVVDEEAAVGVAVPGDPEVRALLDDLVHDELAVLGQQRVRLVAGEVAVRREVGLDEVELQVAQQRPDHRARPSRCRRRRRPSAA